MPTCVTLLKNIVLAFLQLNLKPISLTMNFRLLCHLSVEQIPVTNVITTVNLVIVHSHWYHQTSAAIRFRKPYRRLVAAMSQENRKMYHIIPTIVKLLITHLIFGMNPINCWNRELQIWINQIQSKCPWKILPRSDHTGVRSHVIRWKMFVFIAGNMVILHIVSALICVHSVGLIKTQTGGAQWRSEMYMSPKMATGISISLQHRIALTNIMYLQFKTI